MEHKHPSWGRIKDHFRVCWLDWALIIAASVATNWLSVQQSLTLASVVIAWLGVRHMASRQHDSQQRDLAVRIQLEQAKFCTTDIHGRKPIDVLPIWRARSPTDTRSTGEIVGSVVRYSNNSSTEVHVVTTPTVLGLLLPVNAPVRCNKEHVTLLCTTNPDGSHSYEVDPNGQK